MKKHDIPPNYFYFSLMLTAVLRYLFPQFNVIEYPLNLSGFIVVAAGIIIVYVSWKAFVARGTSESYREGTTCIVSDGLYAYSRNPMYVGMVLAVLGLWVCMMMNIISFAGPLLLFLALHFKFIPYEEKRMAGQFGEEFTIYMEKVRRWI